MKLPRRLVLVLGVGFESYMKKQYFIIVANEKLLSQIYESNHYSESTHINLHGKNLRHLSLNSSSIEQS